MRSFNVESTVAAGVNGTVKHAVTDGAVHLAARLILHLTVIVGVVKVGQGLTPRSLSIILLKKTKTKLISKSAKY